MSVIYNGTTVTKVYYNNTEADSLTWNNTKVGDFAAPYKKYLSSSSISISDFLNDVLTEDNAVFNDNKASQFVGKTITGISNTYDSASNVDWEIIDYNHDGSSNTFDLMAKQSVKDSKMFRANSGNNYNQNYEFSEIRTWLQSYVNNFSSTLSIKLATMDVVYNFNTKQSNNQLYVYSSTGDSTANTTGDHRHTIQDKIKLLSATELGYTSTANLYIPYNEGTIYSNKFSSKSSISANSEMIRYSGSSNSAINWWARSRYANSGNGSPVWCVTTDGQLYGNGTGNSNSVVPVIRLKYLKPYEYYLYTTSSISITDFINNVINDDNVFTENKANMFVGKTITGINNTYDSAYNVDWEIIDYNNDDSSNTFDLIAKKSIKDSMEFREGSGSNYFNQNYEFSDIRTWLQSYINNFSSPLSTKLATMDVICNFNRNEPNDELYYTYDANNRDTAAITTSYNTHILSDKIKLLSCTELGYTSSANQYLPYDEGNRYSNKFSSKSSISANNEMVWYSGSSNSATSWWTRTRCTLNGSTGWYLSGGVLGQATLSNSSKFSLVPVIRLTV